MGVAHSLAEEVQELGERGIDAAPTTHPYAIGGNEQSARLMGLSVARTKIVVYVISGVCGGLAGLLLTGLTVFSSMALATMLVVLTTDAQADSATLDAALRLATAKTFDRLDSDVGAGEGGPRSFTRNRIYAGVRATY